MTTGLPDPDTILTTARDVITAEARALDVLAAGLGDSFTQTVTAILQAQGRVIVSGMGKSGHIARKIAATLASTGTPAHFVHPAEASHGDLGMLGAQDVVILLSNSGETPELADIITYTRRFGITLVGVASRPDSALMRQADIQLPLPQQGEACGTGMVPTISTTMTLALGDALAVALMQHRRFGAADFREFHPGGKLGAALSRVGDLMHRGTALPLVAQDTAMAEALLEVSSKGFGVTGVTDTEGRLAGIITDGDLRRHMDGLLDQTAGQVMTASPRSINAGALAAQALAEMTDRTPRVTCLFVLDADGRPEGLIHIHDCLRAGLG